VFPLRARTGGVLVRTGHTEAAVDLARIAGLQPAGVICEIMNADGTMARMPQLEEFSAEHGVPILSVADIIDYRLRRESLIEVLEDAELPTNYPGKWRVKVVRSYLDGAEHFVFVCGDPTPDQATLVRVQHRSDTLDIFMKRENSGLKTLSDSMELIADEGLGVIVYLDKEGRGALDVLRSYGIAAPDPHAETAADVNQPRPYLSEIGIGAQILASVGVGKMRVLTNRPKKLIGLDGYGLEVVEQVAISGEARDSGDSDKAGEPAERASAKVE
jgi:3,4-dihydroxy 2-butanone 4-phosphate synthase/GTP cyclohydrolase II